jgi:uncharacterized protein YbjT (DUF2867 family)
MTPVLVTGGIGPTARKIVQELLRSGMDVRVLVASANQAQPVRLLGAQVFEGDLLDVQAVERAVSGVEKIFLTSPPSPNLVEAQCTVIDAAVKAHVRHIVKVSVLGARADSPSTLNRAHGTIEAYLERSGIPFAHLRPNLFMENILEAAPLIRTESVIRAPLGEGAVSFIDRTDLARVAAYAIRNEKLCGHGYDLTGPESLKLETIAQLLARVLARDIRYEPVSSEVGLNTMLQAGAPPWFAQLTIEMYDDLADSRADIVTRHVPEITGSPAKSFYIFALEHAAELRGETSAEH